MDHRAIQAREFTAVELGRSIIRECRVVCCEEQAEVSVTLINSYLSGIFAEIGTEPDTDESMTPWTVRRIPHIAKMIDRPEIGAPIIQAIAIYMVNKPLRGEPQQETVKVNYATTIIPCRVKAFVAQMRIPSVPCNALEILIVDKGDFAARQRDLHHHSDAPLWFGTARDSIMFPHVRDDGLREGAHKSTDDATI